MGNLQSLVDLNEEELDKEMAANPLIASMNLDDEKKKQIKDGLKHPAVKKLAIDLKAISDNAEKEMDKIMKNYVTSTYDGSCGIEMKDEEAQRIMDKYFSYNFSESEKRDSKRGEMNEHAKDMLNIFRTWSFKQLRECEDRYPESAFWSNPLNWLFQAHDPDFQEFLKKDGPIDIDHLLDSTVHDKTITREVLEYLTSLVFNA